MPVIYANHHTNGKNSSIANRNFKVWLSSSKYLCIIESHSLTNMNSYVVRVDINVRICTVRPFIDNNRASITNRQPKLISHECLMNFHSIIESMKVDINPRNFIHEFFRSIF